jgi:hypothetical protein
MAITDATYPYASRMTGGTLHHKNIYSNTFGYTETQKKVAAGSTTAVLAATNASSSVDTTITSGITNPDVPRVLSVTVGGTAASVQSSSIVVTGTNTEGKTITESFITTIATTGTINGTKAFKSVTSILVPKQVGSGVTIAVGTLNILGINHRLFKNNTTVKVYSATTAYGVLTLQGAPTITVSGTTLEINTVTPATTPDGTTYYIICYAFDNWALAPFQDQPEYSTTTSTSSTSSSTSTTTITTSTSSTSSSTSSTSSSTSSTSSSTSSTSTSTTTTP